MNAAQVLPRYFEPESVPVGAPGDLVSLSFDTPKQGWRTMTWQSSPGAYVIGPELLTIQYEEIDSTTFQAECALAKAWISNESLPGSLHWARSIAISPTPYTGIDSQRLDPPVEGDFNGVPDNLFFKIMVESQKGSVYNGGRFYRINEIARWHQDMWGSLGAVKIISAMESLIEHEEKYALGVLKTVDPNRLRR